MHAYWWWPRPPFACGFFWLRNLWGAASASPVYVESVADITGINTGDTPRFSGVVEPQATYEIKKDDTKTVAEIYVSEGDQVTPGDALFRYGHRGDADEPGPGRAGFGEHLQHHHHTGEPEG